LWARLVMSDDVKTAKRRPGEHGHLPLLRRTRQKVLADLLRRAEEGDTNAAAALVMLSFEVEQLQHEVKILDVLNAAVAT
jgi:hypothetical protein